MKIFSFTHTQTLQSSIYVENVNDLQVACFPLSFCVFFYLCGASMLQLKKFFLSLCDKNSLLSFRWLCAQQRLEVNSFNEKNIKNSSSLCFAPTTLLYFSSTPSSHTLSQLARFPSLLLTRSMS